MGRNGKKRIILLIALVVAAALWLSGCFLIDIFGKIKISSSALYDQVKNVGPVFTSASSSSSMKGSRDVPATYEASPLSQIYATMREYVEGDVLDASNIYKAMFEISEAVEQSTSSAQDKAYDTETQVEPTLALSMPVAGYTRGGVNTTSESSTTYGNSWAVDKVDDLVEFLFARTTSVSSPAAASYYLVQSNFNPVTGDIEFDLCYTVEYTEAVSGIGAGSIYAPRVWLKGNSLSHAFQLKGLIYGGNTNTTVESLFSYAATGVAQGTGEYMVFHVVKDAVEYYYKIPAGATETDLQAIFASYPAGMTLAEVTAADTNGYIVNLPATLFTMADAGTRLSLYANDNVLTPLP